MRYYLKDGKEFVENGKSLIQVKTLNIVPSPYVHKRIVRVLRVTKVLKPGRGLIHEGETLGLSFPFQSLNTKDYTWGKVAPGTFEEVQVTFEQQIKDANKVEGEIDDGTGPPLIDFSKQ